MAPRIMKWALSATALLSAVVSMASAQGVPREFVALVGAGQDTVTLNAFFPGVLRVAVGDTVTWQLNSDEIHTVSFIEGVAAEELTFGATGPDGPILNPMIAFPTRPPGAPMETYGSTGFASSGIMSQEAPAPDAPPNNQFSLTFSEPGTFNYFCLIHEEFMMGTVTVEAAGAAGQPSPEAVLERAQAEIEPLLASLDLVREAAQDVRTEPGPDGAEFVFVKAGILDLLTPDPRAELLEFLPENVTVRTGDTVIWGSTGFHTITFNPVPPLPEFIRPEPQEAGPPLLHLNTDVLMPAKPAATYQPQEFFNSGDIGFFSMNGASWALTFDEPGVYEYACLIHAEQGMVGTITVVPR